MSESVLVTGAGGFIGRALVRRLAAEGHEVRALVRTGAAGGRFPDGVRVFRGDVRFAETLAEPTRGCTSAFHLAARMGGADPEDYREVNVFGSEQLARALAQASPGSRLIFMSSVSAMGPRVGPATAPRAEADLVDPGAGDPYGASKREAEHRLTAVAAELGLGLDIVRPGMVYGPGDPGWFADLIQDVAAGRAHRMGPGDNHLGLVYVEHLVEACAALLRVPPSGGPFIAVDPDPPTLDGLLDELADAVGRPLPRRRWSPREARLRGFVSGVLSKRTGEPTSITKSRVALLLSDQWFDGEALREHLPSARPGPRREALRETVACALGRERAPGAEGTRA